MQYKMLLRLPNNNFKCGRISTSSRYNSVVNSIKQSPQSSSSSSSLYSFYRNRIAKFGLCGLGVVVTVYSHSAACAGATVDNNTKSSNNKNKYIAYNDNSNGNSNHGDDDDFMAMILMKYGAHIQQVSFGSIMGFCSGVALKKVGDEAAVVVGLGFVILQALQYLGYIKIDYNKLSDDVTKTIDADSDGKLTISDFLIIYSKLKKIMLYNLPSSGGFLSGFITGIVYAR